MELKHEGFSIREYVSRIRSASAVKCWPFDEATGEGSIQSLLPPITVKKFIWWLDDIQESSINFDEGVKVKCSRSKAKHLKKRSISKIDASKLEFNWGMKGKRKRTKKMKKKKEIIVLEKLNDKTKKVIRGNDKDKCFGFNLQYEKKAIANSNLSYSRKSEENDICDHVSVHKNKPRSPEEKRDDQVNSISLIQKNIALGLKTNPSLPFENLNNMSHGMNRGSQETRNLLDMSPKETPRHPNCIFPPGFSRMSHDYVTLPLNSRGEFIALSSTTNRQTSIDLVKTDHGNGNIPSSTMRLMGKEFTVGGKVSQGDGHIWKDELRFSNGLMEKSRDYFLFPSEVTNNYGIGTTYPYYRPHNNNKSFQFRDSCSFVSSSDIRQLINKQSLPRAPISAIRFPFMHPDLEQHAQSDSSGTHLGNGSLLFDAAQKMGSMGNFQTHDNLGCTHRPLMM
ncbi:hypothetical protein CASFOL_017652 [Castilleja foliolosa]|uniref:Uncharacterized protein n=1 Tax=Castilleja foliolosa TaxID=1961234 RepID=A0ABD3D9M5_9LAMI